LTKRFEEFRRSSLTELARQYAAEPGKIKGEIVLVVGGGAETAPSLPPASAQALAAELLAAGLKKKEASRLLAERSGLSRREAYRLLTDHLPGPGEGRSGLPGEAPGSGEGRAVPVGRPPG
jgi:16S rRNA (cytidine1402-2'-O)-methyltransferase